MFCVPSLVGAQVGVPLPPFQTCFGTVNSTVTAVENAGGTQLAGMTITFTFPQTNFNVDCALFQCVTDSTNNQNFSFSQVGAVTNTSFTVQINRTDEMADWNQSFKFLASYLYGL